MGAYVIHPWKIFPIPTDCCFIISDKPVFVLHHSNILSYKSGLHLNIIEMFISEYIQPF